MTKKVYHVNKALQMVLIFIPFINLWGWWRVGHLGWGMGLNALHYVLSILSMGIFSGLVGLVPEILALPFFVIAYFLPTIPAIYFMNKWTNQRNAQYHNQEKKFIDDCLPHDPPNKKFTGLEFGSQSKRSVEWDGRKEKESKDEGLGGR